MESHSLLFPPIAQRDGLATATQHTRCIATATITVEPDDNHHHVLVDICFFFVTSQPYEAHGVAR